VGRPKIGDTLDVEALVEAYLRDCMHLGELPTVKVLAGRIGVSPVTLYRRYLEATGKVISEVLRERHSHHLRRLTSRSHCLEQLAALSGYSCARSVRRRLKSIDEASKCAASVVLEPRSSDDSGI
jgi:AraC-like DNA-binding protein